MERNQKTRVVGTTRWLGPIDVKNLQEPWLWGPEDKDQDGGSHPGACQSPGPGAPELELEEEASPGPAVSQAQALRGMAGWRKGAPAPGPSRDQGPGWSSEHSHAWESSPDPGALPLDWTEGEAQDRGSHPRNPN
ncbi:hypothetical protein NDU88_001904 [Pleurodeles waltl]|uniref:Uncharacterized protein n=1 Tax=Pleurodeles waltl TaxID=8319 RepID=A0AAV7M0M0_PLEWA|nr:hypothetical protein NDU88_001904 [Pleurodeles waltl]